ncbi:MAG: hypothetical protein WA192_11400 [Candidatus Acidiferrales bacterium]
MNPEPMSRKARTQWSGRTIGVLALGVMLSGIPALAQSAPPPQDPQQQQDQQAPPDQSGAAAPQAPQDQAAQPPDDPSQQGQPPQQDQQAPPPQTQNNRIPPLYLPPTQQQNGARPANLPDTLTLPAGTVVQIRTSDWLSSDRNKKGDQFMASLVQPIVADGWVVMRRGQNIVGQVTDAQRAGRVKGVSKLQLDLSQLTLVDGQLVPVETTLLNASAGTSNGRDAAAVGVTTGAGAAIGAAAAGGPGAAIGAGAGFVASIAGVLLTRGKPTIIPPEDVLTFRLQNPVTISTVRSQVAFRPVTPQDYAKAAPPPRPRLVRPYPPPYGYYGYPCCAFGYGPYPAYYGFYGPRWGW